MAQSLILPSFAGGELSPTMFARVDLAKYQSGAQVVRNFFVDYRGGVTYRPGTKFISAAHNDDDRGSRLIPFVVAQDQAYVLELTTGHIYVFYQGVVVANVLTSFTEAELFQIKFVQSADVMTLTHFNHMPFKLSRTGLTTFTGASETIGPAITHPDNLVATALVSGPFTYCYVVTALSSLGEESVQSGLAGTASAALDPTAATPKTIGLHWSPVDGAVGYNVYKWGPVPAGQPYPTQWGYIGQARTAPQFTDINIAPDFARTPPQWRDPFRPGQITAIDVVSGGTGYNGFTNGAVTGDGVAGDAFIVADETGIAIGTIIANSGHNYTAATFADTGAGSGATFTVEIDPNDYYPGCVGYYQQRRVYAGSLNAPTLLEFSQTGAYANFNFSPAILDSDAISLGIAAREVNVVKHLIPMHTGLIIFTTGSAYLVNGGDGSAAITPTNISCLPQAATGAGDLPPIVVNYNILFQQAKGSIIRDMAYQWQTQSYYGTDRSMLSNHLFEGFQLFDWAFAEVPHKLLFVVRDDGQLLSMTYVPDQEVYGWARHDTQGLFRSICTIPENNTDAVYVVVRRHVNLEDGTPCWKNYIEKFVYDEECCIFESWFLDSAVGLTGLTLTTPLYLQSAGGALVTITSFDPCVTDPGGGPFHTSASFVMQAKENYDPTRAQQVDGGTPLTQPDFPPTTEARFLGHGFDQVNRELVYAAFVPWPNINPSGIGTNNTGHTLWDGLASITPGATFTGVQNLSFMLARKNIDTGLVTFYPAYDPGQLVPSGIGGGDGTWRRYVSDHNMYKGYPCLTDPRTHDAWVHTESCVLYVFRKTNSYALAISPLRPSGDPDNAVVGIGMNATWVYAREVDAHVTTAKLYLVPRLNTAAEIAADVKLAYATYAFPAAYTPTQWTHRFFETAVDNDGNFYLFSAIADTQLAVLSDWKLHKFTQPSAFTYPTPPSDGGFTDVSDWTSSTGPNTNNTDYNGAGPDVVLMFSGSRRYLHGISSFPCADYKFGTDPLSKISGRLVLMTFDTTTGVSFSQVLAQGYMTAAFVQTVTPSAAAFAVTGKFYSTNSYLDRDLFYADDLYNSRWFFVEVYAVSAGVVDTTDKRLVLIRLDWNGMSMPAITVVDEQGWDTAYAAYGAALVAAGLTGPRVVSASIMSDPLSFKTGRDNGVYDPTNNEFWFSGLTTAEGSDGPGAASAMFYLESQFHTRGETALVSPPLLRLTYGGGASVNDVVILVNDCGQIRIDSVDSTTTAHGTIIQPFDLALPGDPSVIVPILEGEYTVVTPTAVINGLNHLEDKTVYALADGKVQGPLTVESGSVTLAAAAATAVVGLKYQGQFQTLRLDAGDPTIQGKRKLMPAATLRVKCCAGLKAGTNFAYNSFTVPINDDLADMRVVANTLVLLQTGDFRVNLDASWDREGWVVVQQDNPVPATILGIIPEVLVGDTQR